jgi:tetratricopeptide (TPR) repeat protein
MSWSKWLMAVVVMVLTATAPAADELRNVKRGEPFPEFRMATIDGKSVDSAELKGTVYVVVCLSAEQRSSELAAIDSAKVVHELGDTVKLVQVTADVIHKSYFQKFRDERKLDATLALDADRVLFGKLGLIVFPTTAIVNAEGKLAHVITLHSPEYAHTLDTYVRHAMGSIDDKEVLDRLKARATTEGSPKSVAATHRAAARFLREKGKLPEARVELGKAREQDPKNPDILLDLADLDLYQGQLDEADALVAEVLGAQAEHRRAKQLRGITLYRRGNLADAEKVLLEALELNPEPSRVHYYLGRIYEKQSDTTKALEHYREALRKTLNEPEEK